MPDVFSKKIRSQIMSKIRSTNTKVERDFRKRVWAEGLRYRLYYSKLPGRPDMAFVSKKVVVFIDGCFWHKCPKCFKRPASNTDYWDKKIEYNISKDKRVSDELKKLGWKVLRFWEHDIKNHPDKCMRNIKQRIS